MMKGVNQHFVGVAVKETKMADWVAEFLVNEVNKITPGKQLFQRVVHVHERAINALTLDGDVFNLFFNFPNMLEYLTIDKSRNWWNTNYHRVRE
jgi:hypothetical protein